jgi:hypothetical protein
MQRKYRTKIFSLNEMIDSLNSIYSKIFSFLSFIMEKFQKSTFDWETLNYPPYLDLFARFLKLFQCTAMLIFTSPTNSESFIPVVESRCKLWYVFKRTTHLHLYPPWLYHSPCTLIYTLIGTVVSNWKVELN